MAVSLDDFEEQKECVYKGERYSARDNGAVLRYSIDGKRQRPSDNQWTFGKLNKQKGYFYLSSEPVHRIVATAFHGIQPSEKHIVDHIDTNQRNNRPENLRWITRLENILLNPITLSRIIYKYGNIENFLSNPSKPLDGVLEKNFDWMRTVTKEESDNARSNLIKWAKEGKIPKGGKLGEWVFFNLRQQMDVDIEENPVIESLTQNAVQRNWKTSSAFPCCPQEISENPIETYASHISKKEIFSRNQYSTSIIEDFVISKDGNVLWIMCSVKGQSSIKPWSLAEITFENKLFVHTNLGSFFEEVGARKYFTLAQGLEWTGGDVFDDNT